MSGLATFDIGTIVSASAGEAHAGQARDPTGHILSLV